MAKAHTQGIGISPKRYAQALDDKDQLAHTFTDFLSKYDIWITPVCASLPFSHRKFGKPFVINGKKVKYFQGIGTYTFSTALSGHPILVIPIGLTSQGLPAGVQIHARKWHDRTLLKIGQYLEQFTDGFQAPRLA